MAAKIPLILIPGLLADAALWRHQIEHLRDLSEPLVADITGVETVGDAALAVLEQAPAGPLALAGQSLGGYICFELMRQTPERIDRLALVDTSARGYTDEQRRQRREWIERAETLDFSVTVEDLSVAAMLPRHQETEHLVSEIRAMGYRVGKDACIRQIRSLVSNPDNRAGLGEIRVPTLVVGGRQDPLLRADVQKEMADGIAGATYVPIEDSGHFSEFEQAHAVTAVFRYWLQVDR